MFRKYALAALVAAFGWACTKKEKNAYQVPADALFRTLDSAQTGIAFRNQLPPDDALNILEYLYYYNGAGVAAGDVNNDGLTDLFFVANRGKNQLYLNKGNFRFENATEKAGVGGFADWKTGVSMADVNGDGWLDIYVCAVGNYKGLEGANELYINQKDGTFAEKAAEYGLDFTGFATQAAFFDYDLDGDLDCYLLNHAVHTSRSYDRVTARDFKNNEAGDYLMRNDGQRFTDVSQQAGIYQAAMGYGLGVSVADLNNDGLPDIYVSNDFHEDDYYYLNNGNGTFTESVKQAFAHLSRFSMGNDIADVNNDGWQDIVTLDMYPEEEKIEKSSGGEDPLDIYLFKLQFGYHHQFSRNCLQINQQGKKFAEVGALAGIAATDWSWAPLLADFDLDGCKDLFITNGIVRRPNDLDYVKFAATDSMMYVKDLTPSLKKKAIELMPEAAYHNFIFAGTDSLRFQDRSEAWGMGAPSLSNGAVYADLDNDGDLDLVTNNIDQTAGIFQNQSRETQKGHYLKIRLSGTKGNRFGLGAKVVLKQQGRLQLQEMQSVRGFLSSVEPSLLFGCSALTTTDTLAVIWPSGKMEILTQVAHDQTLTLREENAQLAANTWPYAPAAEPWLTEATTETALDFVHRENDYYDFFREGLMPFKLSVEGPKMAVGDVNADGLDDFYIGGAKWQAGKLFVQKANGQFVSASQATFAADSTYEDTDALFFDADNDKDLDLYVVTGGNEFYGNMAEQFDRLYINDGQGNFSRRTDALPPMYENKGCVTAADFDRDGDLDLFVGGRVWAYFYGRSPQSYLLVNDGKGRFTDQTDRLAPALRRAGMLTAAVWGDTDRDGDLDLVVTGDWMPPVLYENQSGKLAPKKAFPDRMNGLWQSLHAADVDKDGDLDLLLGNLGLNTKLRKNGHESALKMYVKDIDGNKSTEQIVAYQRPDGEWYPLAFKDELGKQLPAIVNKKYNDYRAFAGQRIEDIFTSTHLDSAEIREVNRFESVWAENNGKGQFTVKPLPLEAQYSKIYAFLPTDLNRDGQTEYLVGGNYSGVSPYQGRYDAFNGLLLEYSPKAKTLVSLPQQAFMNGEVRDLEAVRTAKGLRYLAARNKAEVLVLKPTR
jgi:hypothetical protein